VPDDPRASIERFDKFDDRDAALVRWRFGRGYVSELARARYDRMMCGGRRILDVGCGVGEAARFAPAGADYVGIDLSEPLVRAGHRSRGTTLLAADVTRLPFADAAFDRVLCMGVLHHLSAADVRRALTEMTRILRPGGEIVLVEPNPLNPWNHLMAWLRPAERGILHTGAGALRRTFEAAPGLEIAESGREHTRFVPSYLTFLLRRWSWITGPRTTRLLMAWHALFLYLTPPAFRSHTFWRLRKRT